MRVTEIFFGIQGEGTRAGRPCVFVRFTGCDLRCSYCDTAYAFQGGEELERRDIVEAVKRHPCRFVLLTGGEPTLQAELPLLARDLLEEGYEVAVETHGQRPLDDLPIEVIRIADLKTPGSGVATRDFSFLARLRSTDELKIVICSRADFDWSAEIVRARKLEGRLALLMTPAFGRVDPKDLAKWILESGLNVRLSLQIHKVIWGAEARGV